MSNSQTSTNDNPFLATAGLVIVLTAVLAAAAWPAVLSFARSESGRISLEAKRADGAVAELDYRVAYELDHTNQAAATAVAGQRLDAQDSAGALLALETAGESQAADRIRVRAALEAGNAGLAEQAAARLSADGASEQDIMLAGLAFATVGKRERIGNLKGRVSSLEASRALLRAESGNVALAEQLRVTGLPISSRRILEKSQVSLPRNLLLAGLIQADGRKADLPRITQLMREALLIDPSNLDARSRLIGSLRAQGRTADADAQQKLLDKLNSGRP